VQFAFEQLTVELGLDVHATPFTLSSTPSPQKVTSKSSGNVEHDPPFGQRSNKCAVTDAPSSSSRHAGCHPEVSTH
jgi:hypothetical protein